MTWTAGGRWRPANSAWVATARDPEEIHARRPARVEPAGDRLVERERALAAAGHEHHRPRAVEPEARQRRRAPIGRRRGDRVAGIEYAGLGAEAEQRPRLRQAQIDVPHPAAQQPRREAGIRVLFLHRGRDAMPRRPPDHRRRGVAPGAQHRDGTLLGEQPPDLTQQVAGDEGPADVLPPGAAVDRLGRQEVEPEVPGREQAGLDAAHRADQHRLHVGRVHAERLGDGERRHQVAAGAAAGDEDTAGRVDHAS